MAGNSGTQGKLKHLRPPRVSISYDVEIGGAFVAKELPFVMGVLGDFSGSQEEPLKVLKQRSFVEVTPDNFDEVLAKMTPRVAFTVANRLSDDPNAGKVAVDLKFTSLDDFAPDAIARQVTPLRELLDLRTKLANLRGSLQGNDRLDEILQATVNDAARLDKLKGEIGLDGGAGRE